ncbi:MAG: CoA transferase [Pseudomonadota bacterium]
MISPDWGLDASDYAQALLTRFSGQTSKIDVLSDHPAVAWRRSGLAEVTGRPGEPGLVCPVGLTRAADGAFAAFLRLANAALAPPFSNIACGAVLLGERARLMGLTRKGATAPGGSCHVFPCTDGWLALNAAREDDADLYAAWLQGETPADVHALAPFLKKEPLAGLIERGRLLGLAVAPVDPLADMRPGIQAMRVFDPSDAPARPPKVVDFSSLWAGPLLGSLLLAAGAEVYKVESKSRPDGARFGEKRFFSLLNEGKQNAVFDFDDASDKRRLLDLVESADIVIEASRPRALRQLGIDAREFLQARAGRVWVGITAYGRSEETENYIGFGDDAAAAAGLVKIMKAAHGDYLFAGDAIADPLTGLHGAVAALASWRCGGGLLLDVSLAGVVCDAISADPLWRAYKERSSAASFDRSLELRVGEWTQKMAENTELSYPLRSFDPGVDPTPIASFIDVD